MKNVIPSWCSKIQSMKLRAINFFFKLDNLFYTFDTNCNKSTRANKQI